MSNMKLYLAGPMTNCAQFNYPLFDKVGAELRARGFEIVSPSELDDPATRKQALASADGRMPTGQLGGQTWGDFLARDLKLIADGGIDGVVVLPNWEWSRGARQEVFTALNLGKPVYQVVADADGSDVHPLNLGFVFRRLVMGVAITTGNGQVSLSGAGTQ